MPAFTTRQSGIQVEGLSESLKALRRISKEVGKEAQDAIRDEVVTVQTAAKRVDTGQASESGRRTWIGRSVLHSGAALVLRASKFPRALSTEFGSETHNVHGRKRPQRYMGRRTWGRHTSTGNVIQPTIKRMLPAFEDALIERLSRLIARELDRAGVPRGGRSG